MSQPSNPSYQEISKPTSVTLAHQPTPKPLELIEGENSLYPTAVGLAEPEDDEEDEENEGRAMKHYEIDYAKVMIKQNESVSELNLD